MIPFLEKSCPTNYHIVLGGDKAVYQGQKDTLTLCGSWAEFDCRSHYHYLNFYINIGQIQTLSKKTHTFFVLFRTQYHSRNNVMIKADKELNFILTHTCDRKN